MKILLLCAILCLVFGMSIQRRTRYRPIYYDDESDESGSDEFMPRRGSRGHSRWSETYKVKENRNSIMKTSDNGGHHTSSSYDERGHQMSFQGSYGNGGQNRMRSPNNGFPDSNEQFMSYNQDSNRRRQCPPGYTLNGRPCYNRYPSNDYYR